MDRKKQPASTDHTSCPDSCARSRFSWRHVGKPVEQHDGNQRQDEIGEIASAAFDIEHDSPKRVGPAGEREEKQRSERDHALEEAEEGDRRGRDARFGEDRGPAHRLAHHAEDELVAQMPEHEGTRRLPDRHPQPERPERVAEAHERQVEVQHDAEEGEDRLGPDPALDRSQQAAEVNLHHHGDRCEHGQRDRQAALNAHAMGPP